MSTAQPAELEIANVPSFVLRDYWIDGRITSEAYIAELERRSKARTSLIAAAPELLDALSNLMQVYSEPDRRLCCDGRDCGCMGSTVYQEAEHYARKAIDKAEGRS